jgi:signal transduction histidine kinase
MRVEGGERGSLRARLRLGAAVGALVAGAPALAFPALAFPAFAFDGTAAAGAESWGIPALLAFALVGAGAAFGLSRRRIARLKQQRRQLNSGLATAEAALAASPAASFRWDHGGGERFAAGSGRVFSLAEPVTFAMLLERVAPEDRAALQDGVDRLRREGAPFAATLRVTGRPVAASGRRIARPDGTPLTDVVWFEDVSAETRAAERLAAAATERDRLRLTLDSLPLAVWRRRPEDLALTDVNRAYAEAVDAGRDTVLAEGREIAPAVIADRGRALAERVRGGAGPQAETGHIVVGGSRRLIEFNELPLGDTGEIVGFARDLTDVESAQSELSRHIAAHADVLENIATAIAIYGKDTRLKFFNTAFGVLWRLEEEWLTTEPTLAEILERLRERRRIPEHADFRAFKKQQLGMFTSLISPQEELLHLPDDRTLRLVVSPHPFGGLTFVYEDVTDRLALERSNKTLLEVQRETLDNLYEGIAVFGSDGRLKLSNPAYGRLWQLSPEDLAGEPHVSEIVEKTRSFFEDGTDWPALKQRIIERVTAWTPARGTMERKDGSVLNVSTVPLPDGNVLLSYVDITDSVRIQRVLQEKNAALETAGRLKSEFIANVSYELRTPLNAIIGFAEILTNQYFGELNTRQLDYSRGILDSSHRLLMLINDILDLATIEAGYMTLETDAVDVDTLIANVLSLYRERARKQGLNLEFECAEHVGAINGDEKRLKQALANLISNAFKFTPPGGTVKLTASRRGDEVAITVADTGVGIAEEHQQRVFDKFERGNPQARQSGAGLGLSLVKSFIELHGGRVEMDSQPGTGTRVTCWLAAAPADSLNPPGDLRRPASVRQTR